MPQHYGKKKQPVKAQIAGGPRQKLYQVMRASGVTDSAATGLVTQAMGPGPKKKAKKKKQPMGLRHQIIAKLREIGMKARQALYAKPPPKPKPKP